MARFAQTDWSPARRGPDGPHSVVIPVGTMLGPRARKRRLAPVAVLLVLLVTLVAAFPTLTGGRPDDRIPPRILGVAVCSITSSGATIAWMTDESAGTQVVYGTTTAYGLVSPLDARLLTSHRVVLVGLEASTLYHFALKSQDLVGNMAISEGLTFTTLPEPGGSGVHIWISPAELAVLPASGPAWDNVKARADQSCGVPDLDNQDSSVNVCVLAKALVFARTGQTVYRDGVVSAVDNIVNSGTYNGRALALGRELGAYVIAADLMDLQTYDATLDGLLRAKITEFLTTPTTGGPANLIECHEVRPNNWGTHCGASRAAVAAYLGDTVALSRIAQVFKGWLGDRSSYAGFAYGDLSWQCDPAAPVGINPKGCMKQGHSIDGVLPDDQRRGGSFSWPPPQENYVYEALQGALVQAVLLNRQGYDTWSWSDQALLRAFQWLHTEANYPAVGDDTWQPHLVNHFHRLTFPAPVPSNPGKNMGWTDWTHPVVASPTYEINFAATGWYLVSFPVEPADTSVVSVLSSLAGSYAIVRWYDASSSSDPWKAYDPTRGGDLTNLDNTAGFWILIATVDTLQLGGAMPSSTTTIRLQTGWNLVGFPSANMTYTVQDLKSATGATRVEGFSATGPYHLVVLADSQALLAGEGYWVYVPGSAVDWNVPPT